MQSLRPAVRPEVRKSAIRQLGINLVADSSALLQETTARPALRTHMIGGLTGIRFFAASAVVLFHNSWLIGDCASTSLLRLASYGHLAVSFFFVLSGFVLSHAYATISWSRAARWNFAVSRAARIYPVYLLSFVADAPRAIGYFLKHYDFGQASAKASVSAVAYLSLTQSWIPRLSSAWNAPGWSLSAEVFFYALFPIVALRLAEPAAIRRLALLVAAILVGAGAVCGVVEVAGTTDETLRTFLTYFPPLHLGEFLAGVLAYRWFDTTSLIGRHPTRSFVASAVAGVLWLAGAVYSFDSSNLTLPVIVSPAFALIVIALSIPQNPSQRLLSSRTMVLLGGSSYAIYLLHQPILTMFLAIAGEDRSAVRFAAYVAAVVLISIAVFVVVEEPMRRLIRRRFCVHVD